VRCQVLYWFSERFAEEKRAYLRLSLKLRRVVRSVERITSGGTVRVLTIALLLVILYQSSILIRTAREISLPASLPGTMPTLPTAELIHEDEWVTIAGSARGFSVAVLFSDGEEEDICTIQEGRFSFHFRPEENTRFVQIQVYGDRLPSLYTKAIPIALRETAVPAKEKTPARRADKTAPAKEVTDTTIGIQTKNLHSPPGSFLPEKDLNRGRPDTGTVAITFDGGSYDNAAVKILDVLAERGLTATFFLTGEFMSSYPEVTRRIAREGHEVGNHTYSHPHLTTFAKNLRQETLPGLTEELVLSELTRNEELYRSLTGSEMVKLWRAPYGEQNETIRRWAGKAGYRHVSWTYDPKTRKSLDGLDWVSDRESALYLSSAQIINKILSFDNETEMGLAGGIVLLHLGSERRFDPFHPKLGLLLDRLQERGYKVGSVGQLLETGG
jgi:peptidoglycan-N-acetylmuramic acid deacetylase